MQYISNLHYNIIHLYAGETIAAQTAAPSMELPVLRLLQVNGLFFVEGNWRVPLVLNSPLAIDEDMIIMMQLKSIKCT